jgi:hypothetical protein
LSGKNCPKEISLKKRILELSLITVAFVFGMVGCSNRFNQTGSWLVSYDTSLTPRAFDSDSLGARVTSSQVNIGQANGSDTVLCLGAVPWTEADMLLEFSGLDSVYNASRIISAEVILTRGFYDLQPPGFDVNNLQFEGYALDSTWIGSTFTWDSVARLPRESSNMVLPPMFPEVTDTAVVIQIDTGVVRRWANATDTSTHEENYGFILKPMNISGVVSAYSTAYSGTGFEPTIVVACVINGVPDTVTSRSSSSAYVATTSIAAPSQTFTVQSGTGLHGNIIFDLSRIPNYSVVNYAQLTLFENPIDSLYSGQSPDSLWAYYQTDPSTHVPSSSGVSLSAQDTVIRTKYTFQATLLVQQMVNLGNYGFIIRRYEDFNNLDSRFIYGGNAPDSLRPRLTITYTPAVKKK